MVLTHAHKFPIAWEALGNQPQELINNEWRKPGDKASISKFTTQYNTENAFLSISDGLYTDASFIRLTNLSIAYNFPSSYTNKNRYKRLQYFSSFQ